jgi:dihydroneopterin aldolase
MTTTIALEGMEFYAYHGCYAEEHTIGARFIADVTLDADAEQAAQTDDLTQTIDYAAVYECVRQEMNSASHLLENVAWRIAQRLLARFVRAKAATVKVAKLSPPMGVGGQVRQSSVTVRVER